MKSFRKGIINTMVQRQAKNEKKQNEKGIDIIHRLQHIPLSIIRFNTFVTNETLKQPSILKPKGNILIIFYSPNIIECTTISTSDITTIKRNKHCN